MKFYQMKGELPVTMSLGELGVTEPGAVLVGWNGKHFLMPRAVLANALAEQELWQKAESKNERPQIRLYLGQCVPVPPSVADILLDEIGNGLPDDGQ